MMVEDGVNNNMVPQQHTDDLGGPASQMVKQEEVAGTQQLISEEELMRGITLPALPRGQDADGTDAGEGCRYLGIVRRKQIKFKDLDYSG